MAGDQRRGAFGAVLDGLGQVAPLGVAQRREHPVVYRQQVELRQPREQPDVKSRRRGLRELLVLLVLNRGGQ